MAQFMRTMVGALVQLIVRIYRISCIGLNVGSYEGPGYYADVNIGFYVGGNVGFYIDVDVEV